MKRSVFASSAVFVTAAACATLAVTFRPSASERSVTVPPRAVNEDARAWLALSNEARRLMGEERFAEARAVIAGMLNNPHGDTGAIVVYQLLSQVSRLEGNIDGADTALVAAIAEFDRRPALLARMAWLRSGLVLERADLALHGRRDREAAITLYDQVLDAGLAQRKHTWAAAQNAAMLSAELGRLEEAVRRVDDLIASPAAAEISIEDLVALRGSQAEWVEESGNLGGAYARYAAVWNDYNQRNDAAVLHAGQRLAMWMPTPERCAERLALCTVLLEKISAVRAEPPTPDTPISPDIASIEHQVLVVLADADCPDAELIAWARGVLGLPARPR